MRESGSFAAHLKTIERKIPLRARYENFIGGEWIAPVKGGYFENISPTTGQVICQIARSQAEDVERAIDAAHAAAGAWGRTAVAERARVLNRIADRLEEYLPFLAAVETYDNGKPIRETNLADMPLAVDHFRYFASCVRAQEGSLGELDDDTVAYHYHEPLGVVGQIIPWNFPILMAAWKLAPALAAGNAVVIKPAEQTPLSLLVFAELVQDLLPPGVLNIVNGFGLEAGKPLASNPRIAKIAFTGETTTGRLIMQYASENIIPVTLELGGKSPNIFFEDVASNDQYEKILSYIDIGKKEGAKVLTGGTPNKLPGELAGGYYIKPTVFEGHNKMRVFQEEIFGPVVSVAVFDTPDQALEIANDTLYGLGAGVWTRDLNLAYRFGRGIKAGRVWTNCYHAYPAHAAFGGYKKSGIGRETHKMMLDHYQQTKNVLVSYGTKALGFF